MVTILILMIPLATASADTSSCDSLGDAEAAGVCLMQFMKKQGEGILGYTKDPYDSLTGFGHGHCPECPGGSFVAESDPGRCSHGGATVVVDFDDENIEEFFGDNVH